MSDTPWRLVEPCCGSAALTLWLLGLRGYGLLPYQGSKWRFRKQLSALLESRGFEGAPAAVTLTDCSCWAWAHRDILAARQRDEVITYLDQLARQGPREVYEALHGSLVGLPCPRETACFLFLQRLSFSGKAVGIKDGRWNSPGLNTSSAYGLPATDSFGEVKPMVPSLIRTLGRMDLAPVRVDAWQGLARPEGDGTRTAVYIDPPYRGTTAYPDGHLSRAEVVELARSWHDAGALVIVSEAEAVEELDGWTSQRLAKRTTGNSPFKGSPEWVTVSPGAR